MGRSLRSIAVEGCERCEYIGVHAATARQGRWCAFEEKKDNDLFGDRENEGDVRHVSSDLTGPRDHVP